MTARVGAVVALAWFCSAALADEDAVLASKEAKLSYAFGMEAGANLRQHGLDIDAEILLRGLEDALAGEETLLSQAEARALIAEVQARLKAPGGANALAERNRQQGEAFLAANKSRDGVVVRESGLQYLVLETGSGALPKIDDVVITHYRGTFIDGREFDSSRTRKSPATFRVSGVIKGWTEALQLMPVGSKWQLFVPSDLAYGARGAGSQIGPNTTLIFDVELLGIGTIGGGALQTSAASAVSDLRFSYQLDSRLTRGLYMGERWVSGASFTGMTGQTAVKTKAEGLDVQGRPMAVQPKWTPSDTSLVTVTPDVGSEVEISVKRAGRSRLQVTFGGVTTELVIDARKEGESLKLEIAKKS